MEEGFDSAPSMAKSQNDTVKGKVIPSYFAAVNAEPFTFNGKLYPVKTLVVSPHLLRGFTCPPGCGGCCPRFSLDYLPEPLEEHPYPLEKRVIVVNGKSIHIWSDEQKARQGKHHCGNLRYDDGRCNIHGKQPFSCDFELIRFMHPAEDDGRVRMLTRLFGRGWRMLRVDGEKGALCTITHVEEASVEDALRKLKRLKQWMEYFQLPHRVDAIIRWAQSRPTEALILNRTGEAQLVQEVLPYPERDSVHNPV